MENDNNRIADDLSVAQKNKKEVYKNVFWLALTLLVLFVLVKYVGLEGLREKVVEWGVWGPALLIFLKAATIVVAPLGGGPLYAIAGALFGFWEGFAYVFLGDVLGATVSFYLSRFFGQKVVNYFMGGDGVRVVGKILSYAGTVKGFLKVRLYLLGFPEAASYGAGLTALPFAWFLPIHMFFHSILIIPLIILGDVLLTANWWLLIAIAAPFSIIAIGGFWLLYKKVGRESLI